MLGLGSERVERVPVDGQGRMRADALPALDERTILCLQAGNVNTGAFDPAGRSSTARVRRGRGSTWTAPSGCGRAPPRRSPRSPRGSRAPTRWATDAHKWLNVPYDSGLVFCRDAATLRAALRAPTAAYLTEGEAREPDQYVPEFSRRARGVEVWAALLSLGRAGLRELARAHLQRTPGASRRRCAPTGTRS